MTHSSSSSPSLPLSLPSFLGGGGRTRKRDSAGEPRHQVSALPPSLPPSLPRNPLFLLF
jgi:hypothetical protein